MKFVLSVLALVVCSPLAWAMGWYAWPPPTLREEAAKSKFVLVGRFENAPKAPGGGTTDFVVTHVLKADPKVKIKVGDAIRMPGQVRLPDPKKPEFLVFCNITDGKPDFYRSEPFSPALLEYFTGSLAVDVKDHVKLMRYAFDYLQHEDATIRDDTFTTFENSSEADVREAGRHLDAKKLRAWLQAENTPGRRRGLYATLLASCGDKSDAAFLRKLLDKWVKSEPVRLGGVLTAYTILDPKAGWAYTADLLKNPDLDFGLHYAGLQAARYFQESLPGVVSEADIIAAVAPTLDQDDMADLTIESLRKWGCWSFTDKILALYDKKDFDIGIIRRAIIKYAIRCPDPKAVKFIEKVRKTDPKRVEFAEMILEQEICGPPQPDITLKDVPAWRGSGHYKVDPFIAAAAKFQSLGKEKAQKLLLDLADPKKGMSQDDEEHQEGLFILCRMLFTAKPKGEFRRAAIGFATCVSGTSSNDWTLDLIEIVDDVPFLVVKGYLIAGFPEPVMSYVDYCIKECDWNSFQFKPKTAAEKQKALAKLLALPKLKGATADDKEFLAAQIERPDILVTDFEGDAYPDGWKTTGTAFGKGPAKGTLAGQMPVTGYLGKGLVNSFNGGDASTGTLTSPAIKIERKYLNFLIGGGKHPGKTCINLLVDGKAVRTATGPNDKPGGSEHLDWQSWDVAEFEGKEAVVEIVDDEKGGWGHINVDHIVQSDKKKQAERITRDFLDVDRKYLHLPVKTGAPMRRVQIVVREERAGGPDRTKIVDRVVREFDIELAVDEKPDFWAFEDVSAFKGKHLGVQVFLPADSKALDALKLADDIPDADKLYEEKHRPLFHFTSRRGWLNDPNGLVFANGEWHMFYQHNPFGVNWGNMHWGHAVSDDLVHWKELGEALTPRKYGDFAFSGSAVVDIGNTSGWGTKEKPAMVLAYTSTGRGECIAFSTDKGRTWTEYDQNPVVKHSGRDPKLVWYEKGKHWVMAVYDEFQGKQWIAFHTSPDLKTWTFASRIEGFFECPDLFEIQENGSGHSKWVLYAADGKYLVGTFDGKEFKPDFKEKKQLWYGRFYAPQTFANTLNTTLPFGSAFSEERPKYMRRVQVGWANGITFPGMPFNQQMTVPVELRLDANLGEKDKTPRLYARPVDELAALRDGKPVFEVLPLKPRVCKERLTLADELDAFEVNLRIPMKDVPGFTLDLRGTKLVYDAKKGTLTCKDVTAPVSLGLDKTLFLTVFLDRGSVEVFANGGQVAMSIAAIPDEKNRKVELIPNGGEITIEAATVWRMKSAWKK